MRDLCLDHRRSPVPRTGWRLLAASALLSLAVAHGYVTAGNSLDNISARRANADPSGTRADTERLRQELQEANRIIAELAMPWNALFEAIEQTKVAHVALLTAHPEPKQQTILLSGEAKSYEAMLNFANQLEQSRVLTGIHVLNHEIRQQDAQRPIVFTLAAHWVVRP